MYMYTLIAQILKSIGVKDAYGLIGIPIVDLGEALQNESIPFYGFRNEQAAAYAAVTANILSSPIKKCYSILLSTGGPGFINALPGMTHASISRVPLVFIGGSCSSQHRNKGGFQELDQGLFSKHMEIQGFCKKVYCPCDAYEVENAIVNAFEISYKEPFGCTYIDFSRDLLYSTIDNSISNEIISRIICNNTTPIQRLLKTREFHFEPLFQLLRESHSPLIIAGELIAQEHVEDLFGNIYTLMDIPVLPSALARGVIPDDHELCMTACRSQIMRGADAVIVIGTRLNWMYNFGMPDAWKDDTRFVLIDHTMPAAERHALIANVKQTYFGTLNEILSEMINFIKKKNFKLHEQAEWWVKQMKTINKERRQQMIQKQMEVLQKTKELQPDVTMTYFNLMAIVQHHIDSWKGNKSKKVTIISEGALTLDKSRVYLKVHNPRGRLDAGIWGTMGCGLANVLSAWVSDPSENHLIVAMEGDSAIGFSLAELETLARFNVNALIIVVNNGGLYGGNNNEEVSSEFIPVTHISKDTKYEQVMIALGGTGSSAKSTSELNERLNDFFISPRQLHLINCYMDPNEQFPNTFLH